MVTGYLTQLDDNLLEDLVPLGKPYPLAIATRLSDSDMCRTLKCFRRTFSFTVPNPVDDGYGSSRSDWIKTTSGVTHGEKSNVYVYYYVNDQVYYHGKIAVIIRQI